MSSEPETELILCPACKHALRVPLDWLGQQVQCPECKAMFQAPASDGKGGLTEAVVISRPGKPQPARKPFDVMLLLPAFGLLFCGVVGTIVNSVTAYRVFTDPAAMKEMVRQQLQMAQQSMGFGDNVPEAEANQQIDESAEKATQAFRWVMPTFALVSAVAFLGGVSIATRWNYRLAQLGSVAAALNFPNLCCVPGAVAGLWALLMLSSEEGRAHFGK